MYLFRFFSFLIFTAFASFSSPLILPLCANIVHTQGRNEGIVCLSSRNPEKNPLSKQRDGQSEDENDHNVAISPLRHQSLSASLFSMDERNFTPLAVLFFCTPDSSSPKSQGFFHSSVKRFQGVFDDTMEFYGCKKCFRYLDGLWIFGGDALFGRIGRRQRLDCSSSSFFLSFTSSFHSLN